MDAARTDPREVGQHIEELLAALSAHPDPTVGQTAEDLARDLMGMYGAGLQRIVTLLAGAGPAGTEALTALADDDVVAGLLVLHDLHPEGTEARVARAPAEPPTSGAASGARELQIAVGRPAAEVALSWVALDPPPLRPGQCARVEVAGSDLLLALPAGAHATGSSLVAYRNGCPSCRRPLDGALLVGDKLTCAGCAATFDVRRAGRALDGSPQHLEPMPLVHRAGGWKVAVPQQSARAVR